jgi:signal transduction histidine kinase
LKKTFSDIFASVARVTAAILLIISAVFCGTALTAFSKAEILRLETAAEGEIFFSNGGYQSYNNGRFVMSEFIPPETLSSKSKPELSTFEGHFEEPVFFAAERSGDGFWVTVNSADRYNHFALTVITITAAGCSLGICLIFIVIYLLVKRFLAPIEQMTVKVAEFEGGDYSARITIENDSELGFLAESLNRLGATIEQTENDRKAFIANVSHELRTPMTTISGFIDGILDGTISAADRDRYLTLVSGETKRLSRLVSNMLALSAYDSGKMTVKKQRFDILPLFLNVLTQFKDDILKKDITVNADGAEEFFVNGDEDLCDQVVYNLLQNAVKFCNPGGEINLSFAESREENSIRVKNSGAGLRAEEITRVFERFYKTDESRGMDRYGAGLGLSIVSGIVKLHGGKLIVRSEPDSYTEFEINLPKS